VTRLCGAYVAASCLAQGQTDLCVNRAIDALLAGPGSGSGRLSSGAAAGLAVGVVAGERQEDAPSRYNVLSRQTGCHLMPCVVVSCVVACWVLCCVCTPYTPYPALVRAC
jgi:hypothetical protein